jgi:signal transduction histidine kinase
VRRSLLLLLVLILGVVFTAFVYLLPGFDVAYRSTELIVGNEVLAATGALAMLFLLLGRKPGQPRLTDHLLAAAFFVLLVDNLFFLAIPVAHNYGRTPRWSAWSSVSARVVEGLLFVAAAFMADRTLALTRRAVAAVTVVGAGVVCGAIVISARLAHTRLPLPINWELSPVAKGTMLPAGSGALDLILLLVGVFFAIAAARLAVHAPGTDPLHLWLSASLIAAALANLNFALFPSLFSRWVFAGDILACAFSAFVLVGVGSEVWLYWRQLIEAAVVEERRRIARDLHDGLAQDLAFIALKADDPASVDEPAEALHRIASAAERALSVARLAITALTEPLDASVLESAHRAAEDVARIRSDLRVEVAGVEFEATRLEREALQWIAREATSNAIRHGRATSLRIRSAADDARLVRIIDNGCGFDEHDALHGLGLPSMRERAFAVGGTLRVRSLIGVGTLSKSSCRQSARGHAAQSPGRWRARDRGGCGVRLGADCR